jgi:hypothetical protein
MIDLLRLKTLVLCLLPPNTGFEIFKLNYWYLQSALLTTKYTKNIFCNNFIYLPERLILNCYSNFPSQ